MWAGAIVSIAQVSSIPEIWIENSSGMYLGRQECADLRRHPPAVHPPRFFFFPLSTRWHEIRGAERFLGGLHTPVGHSGRDGPSEQLLMLNARPVLIYQQVELARGQGVEFFIR
jgi:hypothetical protein